LGAAVPRHRRRCAARRRQGVQALGHPLGDHLAEGRPGPDAGEAPRLDEGLRRSLRGGLRQERCATAGRASTCPRSQVLTRLVLCEPAYRRTAAQLDPYGFELVLVDTRGALSLNGQPLDEDAAQPDWGWFSADSGFGPAGRTLFVSMLKSQRLTW